jgi:BirA family biotin operon repressor/biotin-[acetyl-CoA-carboxylase] ligase
MTRIHYETIDSTNAFLKEHHRELVDFCVVDASHQTAGRGRLGREWIDDGQSALFSILLKTGLSMDILDRLPLLAAVAVHKTLKKTLPGLRIKWPNDLVVHGKKVCGILCESVIEGKQPQVIVIGFGLNVNNRTFPEDLLTKATSLYLETSAESNISDLIDRVATAFQIEYLAMKNGSTDYIGYCNQHSSLSGQTVTFDWNNEKRTGKAGLMNADGSLSVTTQEGVVRLRNGEVTLTETDLPK